MRNLLTFDTDGSFTLDIIVNETCVIAGANVQIDALSMFFDEDGAGNELTVNWTETGNAALDECIMWELYTNDAYKVRIVQLLTENGVSIDAANDVCTSEAGMQEEGRASYDAIDLGEEVAAYAKTM